MPRPKSRLFSGSYFRGIVLALCLLPGCQPEKYCDDSDVSCNAIALWLYVVSLVDRYFLYMPVTGGTEAYSLNVSTGAMSPLTGSPFSEPVSQFVFPDPTGRFLYGNLFAVAPNNIKSYTIAARTGLLTQTPTPTASANNSPVYIEFDPNGRFLFVSNYNSLDISAFSIHQITGDLTKLADVATSCGGCANVGQLRVTPNGKYLYVVGNGGPETITEFSINESTGALTLIGNLNTGIAGADALLVDPTSAYLYTVQGGGTVAGYSINASTGVLTALAGSPFAGTVGNLRGAMHPSGKYLYTVNVGSLLAKHDIAADGSLSAATTISFGTNQQFVTIEPTGRFGFVNAGNVNNFYVFSIDQTNGAPSLVPGNPFVTSSIPGAIAVAHTRNDE